MKCRNFIPPKVNFIISIQTRLFKIAGGLIRSPHGFENTISQFHDGVLQFFDHSSSNKLIGGISNETSCNSLIEQLCANVANIFNAPYARIGLAGSSNTIRQVIGHVLPRARPQCEIVFVDPTCHKSVFGGLIESGLKVVFLRRKFNRVHGLFEAIDLEHFRSLVAKHTTNIAAAIITDPSYEGFSQSIEDIAKITREVDALLCVDAAWGSNFGIVEGLPPCSIQHADIVVTSPHKKGLSPSQVGIVLFQNEGHAQLFDRSGQLGYFTTSPNWNLLANFEYRLSNVSSGDWNHKWQEAVSEQQLFRDMISEVDPRLTSVDPKCLGYKATDPTHVYINTLPTNINAKDWADSLANDLNVDVEMATPNGVLFLIGPAHKGISERLLPDFKHTFDAIPTHSESVAWSPPALSHEITTPFSPRHAYYADTELIPIEASAGRVSSALLYAYPPGIPLLGYGETITETHIKSIIHMQKNGTKIIGLSHDGLVTVCRSLNPQNLGDTTMKATRMPTKSISEFTIDSYPFGQTPIDVLADIGDLFREIFCNPPYEQFAAFTDNPRENIPFSKFAPTGFSADQAYYDLSVLDELILPSGAFRWMDPAEFKKRFIAKRPQLYTSVLREGSSNRLLAFSVGRILTVKELFYTEEFRNPVYYSGREFIDCLSNSNNFYSGMKHHFDLDPDDKLFFALGYGAHPNVRGKNFLAPLMTELGNRVTKEHAQLPALAEVPDNGAGRIFSRAVHHKYIYGLLGNEHAVVFAEELGSVIAHYKKGSRHLRTLIKNEARIHKKKYRPHTDDHPSVKIKETEKKGTGVFAERAIKRGETIARFVGETYTASKESLLPDAMANRCIQISPVEYVFAEHRLAEKINHSCDPNCGVRERTRIVAIKDILPGEEITWDYRMSENSDWVLDNCHCGAERCAKRIEGYDSLTEAIQFEYLRKGAVSSWLLDR